MSFQGRVAFEQTVTGKYVCAEEGGKKALIANRSKVGAWETFQWIDQPGDSKVALRACNGMYVCAEEGGGRELIANRPAVGAWERFTWRPGKMDGEVRLITANGMLVRAHIAGDGLLAADAIEASLRWESAPGTFRVVRV